MFEILTLMQTEKLEKQIQIIRYGSEYWDPILHLEPMAEWGAISPGDIHLVQRADTPERAFELLVQPGRRLFSMDLFPQGQEVGHRWIDRLDGREQAQRRFEPLLLQRRTRFRQQGGDALLVFDALPFGSSLLLDLVQRGAQLAQRGRDLGG